MKSSAPFMIVTLILVMAFSALFAPICCARIWPSFSFNTALFSPFIPHVPFLSPMPYMPIAPPLVTPYPSLVPTINRIADATIIIILSPPANPLTAYAPLGTVTLSPSALLSLGLFLTLAE